MFSNPSESPIKHLPVIKLMIVDDHCLLRQGIARLVQDQPDINVVGEAERGEDALFLLQEIVPDVVLMDVKMPGIGGIEAAQRIRARYPSIRIIGMSSLDVGVIPSRMVAAGAISFITKNVSVTELLDAIRRAYRGQEYFTPAVATKLSTHPFRRGKKVLFEKLSKRELQIAMQLSDGAKVSTIAELLKLSPKTVYTYRYRIFEKLGITSDVELTILAMKNGVSETSEDYMNYAHQRQII